MVGNMDGTPFGDIKTAWANLCKDHSFDDLHFHDHRYKYCTNLLLSGCTLKEASVMDTRPQDRLAARYAMEGNDD